MTLSRFIRLASVALLAALVACKGAGSSSNNGLTPSAGNALLRFLQANPSIGGVDWQVDSGTTYTGATLGLVQNYQQVAAGAHTINFFASGTTNKVGPGSCAVPGLTQGSRDTLVMISNSQCAFFIEPTIASGSTVVIYHVASANAPSSAYALLCAAGSPPTSCQNQSSSPVANAATSVANIGTAPGNTAVVFNLPSSLPATTAPGLGFSVASTSSSTTPICTAGTNTGTGPVILPVNADPNNTSNFMPFNGSDTTFSLYLVDQASSGTGSCNLQLVGTFTP